MISEHIILRPARMGDAGQWQVALGMLGSFGQVGTAAFNALLGGCPWDVALALLEEMNLRRVEKDSLTFSTGIMVCERAEEWLGSGSEF